MGDSLLNFATILLFGRKMDDLEYKTLKPSTVAAGGDEKTKQPRQEDQTGSMQLQMMSERANFARVFGFSFEGHYYDLPRPQIFLVHGDGAPAADAKAAAHRGNGSVDQGGLAIRNAKFADDLLVWAYEKSDFFHTP